MTPDQKLPLITSQITLNLACFMANATFRVNFMIVVIADNFPH